jgi:hypothetical protein
VGDAELWLRPGALPAFEREPGAEEEEPRGVAWEWVEFPWVAVWVVAVLLPVPVVVLAGAPLAVGGCAAAPEPPLEAPGEWLGCEPRLLLRCEDVEPGVEVARLGPVALPPRTCARAAE